MHIFSILKQQLPQMQKVIQSTPLIVFPTQQYCMKKFIEFMLCNT